LARRHLEQPRQMRPKVKSIHQQRKENREKQEAIFQESLRKGNNRPTAQEKDRKEKRRSPVDIATSIYGVPEERIIRPIKSWVCTSYNPDKQVIQLIRHLFVKYPVPPFMYACMLKTYDSITNQDYVGRQSVFCSWFLTIAQGESFQKRVKGIMTKQEAVMFLKAPSDNKINANVWWAKMMVAGISLKVTTKLIDRIFGGLWIEDPDGNFAEAIQFYARYHNEMDKDTFDELTDFIYHKLMNERTFSFKGRTISSMINLSNEWHRLMQRAKLGSHIQWNGMGIPKWNYVGRNFYWECFELVTNKDLSNEGRKQRHCVYGYVDRCMHGGSAIFSLRKYTKEIVNYDEENQPVYGGTNEQGRLTIEINPGTRQMVQVRGPLNRASEKDEREILKLWAGQYGFTGRV
jgi:hypothetical protein